MAGTLMFITYASQDGKNVTVSPRIGTGHEQPSHTNDVQVSVLSGSGIINDVFVVNARCDNCRSWNGGNVNVDSTSQAMIWAAGSAATLESNDINANIHRHQGYSFFNLNLKTAQGAGGVPLVGAATNNNSTIVGNVDPVHDDDHFHGATGFHAFLMCAAFLIVFPGGVLLLRVFEKVILHWAVQSLALLMVFIGVGAGIAISKRNKIVSENFPIPPGSRS